ncbi:MAG: hypothetical protein ACYSWW_11650, partial [Planctomycetota bacterium]
MSKNLTSKVILIVVLVAAAAWTLFPPNKTLKPGIDLAGGTSLIYEIDTQGLTVVEKKDLAQRMINVVRRRIDPANIQNLVWRPQGSTRFEIQMPLASAEARLKRSNYDQAETALLDKNLSPAKILRSLETPAEERVEAFNSFAQSDPNRLQILENLATVHDEHAALKNSRDELYGKIKTAEDKISSAGLDLDKINNSKNDWVKLSEEELAESLKKITN